MAAFALTYDSGHVLPFIADSLVVSPPDATIGYIGVNPVLAAHARRAGRAARAVSWSVAKLEDPSNVEELVRIADVFVVDLGVDASLVDAPRATARDYESARLPAGLDLVFAALERLVEVERARLELGEHPRRIVLVNSSTVFADGYVLAQLDCSNTTIHSRVRRATVKLRPADDDATRAALARTRRLVRWGARQQGRLHLSLGQAVEVADLNDYGGFGEGWAIPDEAGIWTDSQSSELAVAFGGVCENDCVLTLWVGGICVELDESLKVRLLVNGSQAANREFRQDSPAIGLAWRVELPAGLLADGKADLTFLIEEPRSPLALGWSADDDRQLGIHLRTVTLEDVDRSVLPRERVVFSEGTGAERLLGDGWSVLDPTGVWTIGETASLVFAAHCRPADGRRGRP